MTHITPAQAREAIYKLHIAEEDYDYSDDLDTLTTFIQQYEEMDALGGSESRSREYRDGVAFATKRAIEFLHSQAGEMNDPKASAILNSAAFTMGVKFRRAAAATKGE